MAKKLKIIRMTAAVLFAFFGTTVCSVAGDAEDHGAGGMNPGDRGSSNAHVGAGWLRVLFLGNSITLHGELADIGWPRSCGMAASDITNDYVHCTIRSLEAHYGRNIDYRVHNIAAFERKYWEYDLNENLAADYGYKPDVIVFAIGENVPSDAVINDFRYMCVKLLNRFSLYGAPPLIVVRGVFWKNDAKDALLQGAASDLGAAWVPMSDMDADSRYKATGEYQDAGVANHPGDKGMAEIARRISNAIFTNLNATPRRKTWFDANVYRYGEWPADATKAEGGTWSAGSGELGNVASVVTTGRLDVAASTNRLRFDASLAKSLNEDKVDVSMNMTFEVFPVDCLPVIDSSWKSGVLIATERGTESYYAIAKCGTTNGWVKISGPSSVQRQANVRMSLKKESDKTYVRYNIAGADCTVGESSDIEVVVSDPNVTGVDFGGYGAVNSFVGKAEVPPRGLFLSVY